MDNLEGQHCEVCRSGVPLATEAEITEFLKQLPQWRVVTVDGVDRLTRSFTFPDFRTALAFTDRVGALAEAEGHHPLLLTAWGKVTVQWWTHKIRGLHRNDFIMAARTEAQLEGPGAKNERAGGS